MASRIDVEKYSWKPYFIIACILGWLICISTLFTPRYELEVISQDEPVFVVDDRFLSFGIDTVALSRGVNDLRLNSTRLQQLTALLAPSRLRLGGTMSDRLIFMEDPIKAWIHKRYNNYANQCLQNRLKCVKKFLPYFTIDGEDFLEVVKFSMKTDARLLFDFNLLMRNGDEWDPTNAIQLLEFTRKLNLSDMIDWQLGNEPNSFLHLFDVTVPPRQLSRDFSVLKSILNVLAPNSLLVGPDTTRPQPNRPECVKYMKEFLEGFNTTGELCDEDNDCNKSNHLSDYIDAVAWHQYYLNSRTAVWNDFWNPQVYDLLLEQIHTMRENIDGLRGNFTMWLSETSSSYGGGTPRLSNGFASSPMWLDKLGVAALNGISVVVRQSLIGANYSIIDNEFNPLPDWWVSYLHKRLVGKEVISCNLKNTVDQRFYCHCAPKNIRIPGKTSITIFGMNTLEGSAVYIKIKGSNVDKSRTIDQYLLTSDGIYSTNIFLNGKLLTYEYDLPEILPYRITGDQFLLPGHSLGFWVVHDVDMPACA